MPTFRSSSEFACSPSILFDFLIQPANVLKVTPPELNGRLLEGPPRVALGDRLRIETRFMGMRQLLALKVVALELDALLIDEQIEGPFRAYRHERRFLAAGDGSKLTEIIEYEPPGGMLGLLLSPARIERNLADLHAYRIQAMRSLLNSISDPRP